MTEEKRPEENQEALAKEAEAPKDPVKEAAQVTGEAAPAKEVAPAPAAAQEAAPQAATGVAADATTGAAEAKKEPAPKLEKPANCASCKKSIKNKRWYYRNGKYYCTKRCWSTTVKKPAKTEEAPA